MFEQENKELLKLASINKDASEFYETAQDEVESDGMKSAFSDLEKLHEDVANALQSRILANGGDAEADETISGQMRELFAVLMTKISNDVDETLVTHLEEAEDRCLHSMQDAIESPSVSPETKMILQNELSVLRKSHDYMKALKDDMKAAA